jgi:HEAT repeat protein
VHVETGNAALNSFVNSVTSTVVNKVGTAFQQAGAQLARDGRLQAGDTGRVAMMISILSTDQDASVRRTAAWGLHDMEAPEVRTALAKSLKSDADGSVREMAGWALGEQGDASSGPALSDALLHDKSEQVRVIAAWALGEASAKSEIMALETAMSDSSPRVREFAIWAVGQMDVQRAPAGLVNALHDSSKQVRLVSAWALGQIEDKSTAPAVVAALKAETDGQIRSAEMRALSLMDSLPTEIIEESLKSPDAAVRRRAVGLLAGSHGSVEPWPWPRPMPRPMP